MYNENNIKTSSSEESLNLIPLISGFLLPPIDFFNVYNLYHARDYLALKRMYLQIHCINAAPGPAPLKYRVVQASNTINSLLITEKIFPLPFFPLSTFKTLKKMALINSDFDPVGGVTGP